MVHQKWQQIISLYYTFPQFVHHRWKKVLLTKSGGRFRSRQREKRCGPSFLHNSPLYSEAKSLTDCLRNLPEKCQQLLLSAVFLFPCLPSRLYLAIIDLQCVKGHRIEDDSSCCNHGDSLYSYDRAQYQSVVKTLMLRFLCRWASCNLLLVADTRFCPIFRADMWTWGRNSNSQIYSTSLIFNYLSLCASFKDFFKSVYEH